MRAGLGEPLHVSQVALPSRRTRRRRALLGQRTTVLRRGSRQKVGPEQPTRTRYADIPCRRASRSRASASSGGAGPPEGMLDLAPSASYTA